MSATISALLDMSIEMSPEENDENNYTESPVIYSMQSNPDSVDAEHIVNPRTRVMSPRLRPGGSTDHGQVTDDSDVLEGQATGVSQRPQIPKLTSLEMLRRRFKFFH